jgi:hypothetical protein
MNRAKVRGALAIALAATLVAAFRAPTQDDDAVALSPRARAMKQSEMRMMKTSNWTTGARCLIGLLAGTLLLTGCAGSRAYREGNVLLAEGKTNAGLAKLEEAVRIDSRNAGYRIALRVVGPRSSMV